MSRDQDPLSPIRLFLALLPGPQERKAIEVDVSAWHWPSGAARYSTDDWHVTLHFLGGVARERLAELRAAFDLPVEPFELRFGVPMLWPHGLAVELPILVPAPLLRLHDALVERVRGLGLRPDERRYTPHLTLARRATSAIAPAPSDWRWPVSSYALMESTGDPARRYRVVQHYGAAGNAGRQHT